MTHRKQVHWVSSCMFLFLYAVLRIIFTTCSLMTVQFRRPLHFPSFLCYGTCSSLLLCVWRVLVKILSLLAYLYFWCFCISCTVGVWMSTVTYVGARRICIEREEFNNRKMASDRNNPLNTKTLPSPVLFLAKTLLFMTALHGTAGTVHPQSPALQFIQSRAASVYSSKYKSPESGQLLFRGKGRWALDCQVGLRQACAAKNTLCETETIPSEKVAVRFE